MSKQALHEIFSTRMWDLLPNALHGYKATLLRNISEHIPYVKPEERDDRPYLLSSAASFVEKTYVGNPLDKEGTTQLGEIGKKDDYISVIPVSGAILRSGDACSYGSRHHRDALMSTADDPRTLGHIFVVDSPGGSAYSKFDYEQAINYAHSKGQPVIGLVDGMACSAGYAILALCDEVYFVNPHDIVGCIGTMAAFYTQKDGDENAITKERYVEVYATGSPNKNKEQRDAATGDYTALQAEVDDLCNDYQSMVRNHRPNVTDEQLKGATYKAGEVVGTMVDGQGTLQTCIERILALSGQRQATPSASRRAGENRNETSNQTVTEMKEYVNLKAALGQEALESDKDNGVYLNEQLADAAEQAFADAAAVKASLEAKEDELKTLGEDFDSFKQMVETDKAEAATAHEAALASIAEDHQKEMDELKAAHEAALQAQEDAHNSQMTELSNQLGEAQAALAEKEQALAEKEAELRELADDVAVAPVTAEVPTGNSVQGQQSAGSSNIFREGMSLEEKAAAMKERDQQLKNALK